MNLWNYDSSRQALIFFDPATNQAVGFAIPKIEECGFWEPRGGLEMAVRASNIPPMPGQSRIISPNAWR